MAAAPIGTGGGGDGSGADDLSDVTLGFFTANPTAIGPFDISTLAWHVVGVKPRVRVLLDTSVVAAAGSAIVQPAVTAGFTLSAASGQARKTLGHVTVTVDRATCDEQEIPNLLELLRQQIIIAIANPQDPKYKTYWPVSPDDPKILSVTLSNDALPRIQIHMYFGVVIPHWYVPNAGVTVDLAFGLGVQNGAFIAVAPTSEASVDEGLFGWLLGPYLMIALAMAGDSARAAGFKAIQHLVGYINRVEIIPSPGKAVRSAVVEYRNGRPFFGFVECGLGTKGPTVILSELSQIVSAQV
jgi:hypothetical protein